MGLTQSSRLPRCARNDKLAKYIMANLFLYDFGVFLLRKIISFDDIIMTKTLLCLLLIVLVLTSGFSYPTVSCPQAKQASSCMMKKSLCMRENHSCKHSPCSHSKNEKSGQSCAFCILCCAFVMPFKPDIQRDFATGEIDYARLAQSKLTDFNASPWRPPTA